MKKNSLTGMIINVYNKMEDNILNILLVSDVHNSSFQFDNIKLYANENKIKYDYVFYLGDFDSLKKEEQKDQKIINESLESIHHMLILLETISPNVYYIGGNHDPLILFKDNAPKLGKTSINIHKKHISLKEDNNLIIAGIGGSVISFGSPNEPIVPEYKIKNYDIKVWEGFPYTGSNYLESDDSFGKDIDELYKLIEPELSNNKQLLLLTHCGPLNSFTSNVNKNNQSIYTGSFKLQEFINKNCSNILVNAHGHAHLAFGCQTLNNSTSIINPGSARKGRFGELKLVKNKDTNKWNVKSINLLNLFKE